MDAAIVLNEVKKPRSISYLTPGTFSWKCPEGVYVVEVTAISGGGGGGNQSSDGGPGGITSFGSVFSISGGGGGGMGGYDGNFGMPGVVGSCNQYGAIFSTGQQRGQKASGTVGYPGGEPGTYNWLGKGQGSKGVFGVITYNNYSPGGGANGTLLKSQIIAVTPGTIYTITIGVGGTGGTAQATGGAMAIRW